MFLFQSPSIYSLNHKTTSFSTLPCITAKADSYALGGVLSAFVVISYGFHPIRSPFASMGARKGSKCVCRGSRVLRKGVSHPSCRANKPKSPVFPVI